MQNNLSRAQKILISLYKLAGGTKKQVRFEDIAVKVYKTFKADFQLRGYPQYPDTGDIVHKPLYSELKKAGFVLSGNKYFSLTAKGTEYGKRLLKSAGMDNKSRDTNTGDDFVKFTISQQKEIERIRDSAAFNLYTEGKKEEIIDIDFYSYLGVTVRTNKYDFLGRFSIVKDAIEATKSKSLPLYKQLTDCHEYLINKFKENIDYVKNTKGGKR
ncbi:hypothetical protein A3J19_03595 [Candidatus Daviesbacteria bacterium RIFCSPLOWO2_02_FULL_41_8]|uniref:Uncharacterized protein n=2 Tax=Candidatus Daviesiibacteriota TaxID=1752718 RepID=A0A1F5NH89_9BACT|nr:MAG: hypothetical protein A3D83_04050 [Candidatus Daviesbacteria bacterium RIFCSPHIGHO2_02_FULL_41_10]OGE76985.1 MAG: hypothetical protein A3J19_03595 [Candidatus Daviesbacteria bacterium RIFCSPLOWO2_02_FULL_41_8]